ncbi:glycosyltransferase [Paenibacillus thalictri]
MTDIVLFAQHIEALQECIVNIRLSTQDPYRLIVVFEESSPLIEQWLAQQKDVSIVHSKKGAGVAAAYNLGAAAAVSSHIVLMREYMYVSEGWLSKLNECFEQHKQAAMVGPVSNSVSGAQNYPLMTENPKVVHYYTSSLSMTKGRFKRVPRLLSHLIMIRKEAFDRLGGFDERFEKETYEDDDLCYRALQEGLELYAAENCFVRYERKFGEYADNLSSYGQQLTRNRAIAFEKWGLDLSGELSSWKKPITISLCMIVKNEENTLERCLSSVQGIADEIVIVDTGSTDRTKEIASRFTDCIYDFIWIDDFSAARNYAFAQATQEYILWLDADDVLLEQDAVKLRALKQALVWDTDAVSMHYNLSFDEAGNVSSSLRRNRLVKRSNGFRWIGFIHEYLQVYGKIEYADIAVTHDRKHTQSSRNLHVYEQKEKENLHFSTRDLYYYANELFDHELWERSLHKYEEFLNRADGWIEDRINACGRAGDCLEKLGRIFEAKTKALQSFAYTLPRAENCCRLGYYHMMENDYPGAIYWYKTAVSLSKPDNPQALIQHACWTWLPLIQLCVCYSRIGDNETANRYNELAAAFIPSDSRILHNRTYFQSLKQA